MRDYRAMPVPNGLVGLRTDVALSRILGVSRSAAAVLAEEGNVTLDGSTIGKSFKMVEGFLEVTLPDPPQPLTVVAEPVLGMHVLYADDDIVVVDKPAGVAAHPSVGWSGPTVIGGLAAAGYRVTTSGPSERKGIVHRLDAGTSGTMVVATSEHAYTVLKQAFRDRTVEKPTMPSCKATRIRSLVLSTLQLADTAETIGVSVYAPTANHPLHTMTRWKCSAGRPSSTFIWKRGVLTKSVSTSRHCTTPVWVTLPMGLTRHFPQNSG